MEDSLRRVELHHFGWAHTRGDGFVYLPEQKILCTGDAVVNGAFNYTGDGNTGNWPNVVDGALALDVERVLPGHGSHGGREILEGQKAFFEFINSVVGDAFDAGKKLEDVVTVEGDKGVATTIELLAGGEQLGGGWLRGAGSGALGRVGGGQAARRDSWWGVKAFARILCHCLPARRPGRGGDRHGCERTWNIFSIVKPCNSYLFRGSDVRFCPVLSGFSISAAIEWRSGIGWVW